MVQKLLAGAGFMSLLVLVAMGCGRNELADRCQSNQDCSGDRICVVGECLSPGQADAGDVDAGDVDGGQSCQTNADCPGSSGSCFEDQNTCVSSTCVIPDGADEGRCTNELCVGNSCPDYQEPDGCGCGPRACESPADCERFACIDGQCAPCESNDDCGGTDQCNDDGRCVDGPTCDDDQDCPADQSCEERRCVDRPECLVDDDCGDQEICLNGACTYSPECSESADCRDGFECVGGRCFEQICRGADDCESGQVCDAGECVEPPQASSCFVASQSAVISRNQQIALEAFALDEQGDGIPAEFSWTSTNPAVATIDAAGDNAVGQGGQGTTTVTATLADGQTVCDGEIVLTGQDDVEDGQIRVVVVDDETGAGVSGATVELSDGSTAMTDDSGVASLGDPDGVYYVSVFAQDYNYVTIRDLQAVDVRIPVSHRSGSGPAAGFTGQFNVDQLNTTGDVTLGLAGASIAGGLLNLDLQQLLGESFQTQISIPGLGGQEVPLPGGLVVFGRALGFDLDIKHTYYATTSGGARVGWGLAGKVPAARLFQLFQGGGGNAGDVLTTLLPLFNRFDHASKPLNLVEQPRVADVDDLDGDGDTAEMIPDYDSFDEVTLAPSVRQNLVSDVDISNFPQMSDGSASVAVLVGGTLLDGPGFVPLGISATNDDDGDGRPDSRRLTLAPPHGSLAGGRMAVVALAFEPNQVGFQNGVELPQEFSAALWNGQSVPADIGLGTFPDATAGSIDDAERTVDVTADAGPLFRVRLVGAERTWAIWSRGAPGNQGEFSHQIIVPDVADGRADLFESAEVYVDAIAAQVTIDDLVRATGVGLEDAGVVSTSFNRTKLR